MNELFKRAIKGDRDNPQELLQQIGILALQTKAAQTFTTNDALPVPIESFWENSPYSRKRYPVRFVARVVTEWINTYAGSYSITPEERNVLDERIYKLLDEIKEWRVLNNER